MKSYASCSLGMETAADTLKIELEVIYTHQWRLLVVKVLSCRSLAEDAVQEACGRAIPCGPSSARSATCSGWCATRPSTAVHFLIRDAWGHCRGRLKPDD